MIDGSIGCMHDSTWLREVQNRGLGHSSIIGAAVERLDRDLGGSRL